jgi:HK97 family phage prohead protease
MLFQHDPAEPVGIWDELTEDWRGLLVRGRLIPEVVRARAAGTAARRHRRRSLDRLSHRRGGIDAKTRVRRLRQVDLWEISLVTFPLPTGARVRAVKDAQHDLSERLFRRHPRFSFARKTAESGERMAANRSVG